MIQITWAGAKKLRDIEAPIGWGYGIDKHDGYEENDLFNDYLPFKSSVSASIVVWCYARVLMNNETQKKAFIGGILSLTNQCTPPDIGDISNGSKMHLWALKNRESAKKGDIKIGMRSAEYRGYSCVAGICAGAEKVIVADNAHQFIQLGRYNKALHRVEPENNDVLSPKKLQENQNRLALWQAFFLPILSDFMDWLSDNTF